LHVDDDDVDRKMVKKIRPTDPNQRRDFCALTNAKGSKASRVSYEMYERDRLVLCTKTAKRKKAKISCEKKNHLERERLGSRRPAFDGGSGGVRTVVRWLLRAMTRKSEKNLSRFDDKDLVDSSHHSSDEFLKE